MRATLPYRIAAGLLVLMAAGHTYGFLHLKSAPAGRRGRHGAPAELAPSRRSRR
jgi:hypothetical protein